MIGNDASGVVGVVGAPATFGTAGTRHAAAAPAAAVKHRVAAATTASVDRGPT
ncbi:hypothetical protein H7H78_08075 [Mycobacterium shinjukuense]|uniref:Uncharacterized protein n=1 Tax=Mycobacterium shinjukuense TaxID=398694 RepID=A0A7I7MQJ9_9MYCO|nr:hypothetical protein [Mycobacterium shinjukuense]MCV6985390.1 hypothetical protein [Mycobacterium shinjukuense]BBX74514.1 hypothetical protein MSHI_24200 [Mycobacterium shinjukuense]